jgi:hypothetical protein
MQSFTTIISGKDINKFISIPKEFIDHEIRVTLEPIEDKGDKNVDDLLSLFTKAKSVKISPDIDIDVLMNEMNDVVL